MKNDFIEGDEWCQATLKLTPWATLKLTPLLHTC
jgi:hypothetical protein